MISSIFINCEDISWCICTSDRVIISTCFKVFIIILTNCVNKCFKKYFSSATIIPTLLQLRREAMSSQFVVGSFNNEKLNDFKYIFSVKFCFGHLALLFKCLFDPSG